MKKQFGKNFPANTLVPFKVPFEPIPGQEGGRRKHPSCACFVCNVSKEALSDAGFGDSYKPKKYLLLVLNM